MKKTVAPVLATMVLPMIMVLVGMCVYVRSAPAQPSAETALNVEAVLSQLQRNMSGIETLQAGFIQEKELAVFNQKITLKGTVSLKKPSLLAWRVSEPMQYAMVMNGDTLRQWDEDGKQVQEISLAKNPAFQVVIDQMKEWFSGSFKSLEGDYSVAVLTLNPVALEFTPRESAAAAKVIKRISVVFMEDERYIHRISVEENSGDRMSLTFIDTRINEPVAPAVWELESHVR